jgi:acetoin utilization deacetylase AcuC-like enzyme
VKAFYSDTFVLTLPEHHRFPMAKYRLLRERIIEEGLLAAADMQIAEPIDWDDVRLVHDATYVDAVAGGTLTADAQRKIGFPWSPAMVERSRRSVGATLAASREVLKARIGFDGSGWSVAANLAGGTHHACRDHGEGYCVFNDVAVAAAALLRDGAIARGIVVDCDVHQGNGTAEIFSEYSPRGAIFTASFHGRHNYPFRKAQSHLDVEFDDGVGDHDYLAALAMHLPVILGGHRPDVVWYLAGADPYAGDRLGRLKLTIEGLRARDHYVFQTCRAHRIPVVVAMAGGYANDVDAIVTIHTNTIREAVIACASACLPNPT